MSLTTVLNNEALSESIGELISAGHSPSQAAAIAYDKVEKSRVKKSEEEAKKVAPKSDKYVQAILSRALALIDKQISSPISLDHGLYVVIIPEESGEGGALYSGVVYESSDENKASSFQDNPKMSFKRVSIPELVWKLYDRHLIHAKSEEQELRDERVVELKRKINDFFDKEMESALKTSITY